MKSKITHAQIILGASLIMTLAITGCVSSASKEEQQQMQAAQQKFREGYSKLQKGMSGTQVSNLLGGFPIDPAIIDSNIKLGREISVQFGQYPFRFNGSGLVSW